jgi:hypothetical protein
MELKYLVKVIGILAVLLASLYQSETGALTSIVL